MNQKDKKLKELLDSDPLDIAERISGKSYKEEGGTMAFGFGLHLTKNSMVRRALESRGDTTFSMKTEDYIRVIENQLSFVRAFELPFTSNGEKECYYIFWQKENGLLLSFDTFQGDRNAGTVYFNLKLNECKWPQAGLSGSITENNILVGSIDCREALCLNLSYLQEKGTFLKQWEKRPFLWLLHHGDTKKNGYNYEKITAERISLLPQEIQNCITPNLRKENQQ